MNNLRKEDTDDSWYLHNYKALEFHCIPLNAVIQTEITEIYFIHWGKNLLVSILSEFQFTPFYIELPTACINHSVVQTYLNE